MSQVPREAPDRGEVVSLRPRPIAIVGATAAAAIGGGDYAEFGGFHVPSSVEVTWDLTDGPFTYARFNVTALEDNVSEPF